MLGLRQTVLIFVSVAALAYGSLRLLRAPARRLRCRPAAELWVIRHGEKAPQPTNDDELLGLNSTGFRRAAYDRRVDILSVCPDFAMYFKRTTQVVQRGKNEQQRCSYGRETGRRPQVLPDDRTELLPDGRAVVRPDVRTVAAAQRLAVVRPDVPFGRRRNLPF